jgi:protein-S-isoprenylcysteine O-methyltransferase Ste14
MTTFGRMSGALKREMAGIPLPPGQVVGLVLDAVLQRIHPLPVPPARPARRTAGTLLVLVGVVVTPWAVTERRRHTTGSFALGSPEALVTSGPYALSRHPMYVGWWMTHAGIAVFKGSGWAAATLPAGVAVEHAGALWEEEALQKQFGPAYGQYMKTSPVTSARRAKARRRRAESASSRCYAMGG